MTIIQCYYLSNILVAHSRENYNMYNIVPFVISGRRTYLTDWSCHEINKTVGERGG